MGLRSACACLVLSGGAISLRFMCWFDEKESETLDD